MPRGVAVTGDHEQESHPVRLEEHDDSKSPDPYRCPPGAAPTVYLRVGSHVIETNIYFSASVCCSSVCCIFLACAIKLILSFIECLWLVQHDNY